MVAGEFDHTEITTLVYRLGACLDEHRFDDLRELVLDDATVSSPGGIVGGSDGVVAQASRNHSDYRGLQHLITNVIVDQDGDEAKVRANLVATFVRDGTRPEFSTGAVYNFAVRRTPLGWKFASIRVTPVWREQRDFGGSDPSRRTDTSPATTKTAG